MKKFLVFIAIIVCAYNATSAQNIQNDTDYQCYINGISTREDVGGVAAEVNYSENTNVNDIRLTNHNSFTVTVMCQFTGVSRGENNPRMKTCETVVLKPGESKYVAGLFNVYEIVTIARKLSTENKVAPQ